MRFGNHRHWRLALFIALVAILMIASMGSASEKEVESPAAPMAGLITGVVTDPGGGLPPDGTRIKLWRPDEILVGQAAVAPGSGTFSLGPIPNGNYILRAVPPDASPLTPSFPQIIHLTDGAYDAGIIALTYPSLSGTVSAPNGISSAAAWVGVYRHDGLLVDSDWALAGEYQLGGILTGTYAIKAKPTGDDPFWWSGPISQSITPTLSQTLDISLRPANVYGVVEGPTGVPIHEAVAHVYHLDGLGHGRDESNPNGYFAIGELVTGTYLLQVEPPYWRGDLLPTLPVTFTIPPSQTDVEVVQLRSAPKVVQGSVLTNLGTPVEHARIMAHRINAPGQASALSAADGSYLLRMSAGTWALTVQPISSTVPAEWIYPLPPQIVHFAWNEDSELKHLDFEVLTADSNVIGQVELPGGGAPTFTVTVQLNNSEGIGTGRIINPDGTFDIPIPHGEYNLWVRPEDPRYVGPAIPGVQVTSSSTLDVGTLTLTPRDALITGTVTDEGGVGIPGVRVAGWARDHVYGEATTGPDGSYTMAVISGTWQINSAPSPELPYIYSGTHQTVVIASGETVPDMDFQLVTADATIVGHLIQENGSPATDAFGWASAEINGAPIQAGTFAIPVPAGDYRVSTQLAENNPYLGPKDPTLVWLGAGETVTISVTVRAKDAVIQGALWDARNAEVVSGVDAQVLAWSDWAMVGTEINPGNGTYRMGVSADLWHLGYRVDPASDYVALTHRKHIPVESDQTKTVPLPVAAKDGRITGMVLDPAGDPFPEVIVVADGIGWGVEEVNLKTRPDPNGRFQLDLPYGIYNIRAVGGSAAGYLNPTVKRVIVPPNITVPNQVLQFSHPDAIITGTVSLDGSPPISGTALIWGWTPAGAYSKTRADLGTSYALPVISNTTWHVGGVYETATEFWFGREKVTLGNGGAVQDLVLHGPHPKPSPVVVNWDSADPKFVALADGTSIYLPANSLPVTGTVTLHIVPIAGLPHQPHANVYKYGWAFEAVDSQGQPITNHFGQNVFIGFRYDDIELVDWGIEEQQLKPAYFSTSTNSWTFPDSYVIDPATNHVIMQIDHFTDFALVTTADVIHTVYLPAVLR